ncbi:hypothetical protein Tco_0889567, partial [Tanacetum coccineum]
CDIHTAEDIETNEFRAFWTDSSREIATKADLSDYLSRITSDGDFLGAVPSYTSIWDPLRRPCHRLITFSISGRGRAPEKVATTDLFYLRSMDEGTTVNVPYLLAHYLFRYVEGRKQGARMSGGQLVSRLAEHFGLHTGERFQGLIVIVRDLPMIDMDELVASAEAAQAHQEIPKEGVQAEQGPVESAQIPQVAAPALMRYSAFGRHLEEIHVT